MNDSEENLSLSTASGQKVAAGATKYDMAMAGNIYNSGCNRGARQCRNATNDLTDLNKAIYSTATGRVDIP